MDSNNVVKSLWISSAIGDLQHLCIKSFIAAGIEFHLYTYGDIVNLPKGVIIKDANEILERSLVFRDRYNTYATFSDWFRIKLLDEIGGWWVDCDVLLLKKFDTKDIYVFATESCHVNGKLETRICNAVIKLPKKSVVGRNILYRIEEKLKNCPISEIKWTEIGAGYLKEEIVDNYLEEYIVTPETFCPNPWNTFDQVSSSSNFKISRDTYSVHLWNNMWQWNNIDPLQNLTKGSLLWKTKHKLNEMSNTKK